MVGTGGMRHALLLCAWVGIIAAPDAASAQDARPLRMAMGWGSTTAVDRIAIEWQMIYGGSRAGVMTVQVGLYSPYRTFGDEADQLGFREGGMSTVMTATWGGRGRLRTFGSADLGVRVATGFGVYVGQGGDVTVPPGPNGVRRIGASSRMALLGEIGLGSLPLKGGLWSEFRLTASQIQGVGMRLWPSIMLGIAF